MAETLTITTTDPEKKDLRGAEMLRLVKEDLAAFEEWFKQKDGPLHPTEESILTTYIGWKLGVVQR